MASSFGFPNLLCRYADPALRATLNVRRAPTTDPAVATAAYSYHGLRWLAARIAVRMSGPPNVGRGELSRIARKKSPSAPKWRNIEVTPCPRFRLAFWMKAFNMGAIYQLCWTILRTAFFCSRSYAVPSGGEALNSDQAGIWSSIRRIISRVRN